MSKEWYYRLGDHDESIGFLWSGMIKSEEDLTEAQAREMVRRREHLAKLPSRTIVLSADNLTGNKKS